MRLQNPRYIYDLLIRSETRNPVTAGEMDVLVTSFLESKDKEIRPNKIYGNNYYQMTILSPPETIQIRWHPTISSLADLADEEDSEAILYDIIVSLANPHVAHMRELSDKRMESLITLMNDLSNYISQKLSGGESEILVTVNRLAHDEQPKTLRPPNRQEPRSKVEQLRLFGMSRRCKSFQKIRQVPFSSSRKIWKI